MFHFNQMRQTQIAVATLSQLAFYINPETGSVSAPLPVGQASRFAVEAALRTLGIDVAQGGDVMAELPDNQVPGLHDATFDFAHGSDLLFDENAVHQLLAAGVKSSVLSLVEAA